MRALTLAACLAAGLASAACTHPVYVYATGYTGGVSTAIAPGTPVALVPSGKAPNPLLEEELLAHLGRLFTDAGFPVAPLDQARVAVFVDYGTGSHPETQSSASYTPGTSAVVLDSAGRQVGTVNTPGTWSSSSEVVTAPDTWLRLTALDAGAVRDAKPAKPLWIGEAKNSGADVELRRLLGYLAIPAVEKFGRNTAQSRSKLREGDARVPAALAP